MDLEHTLIVAVCLGGRAVVWTTLIVEVEASRGDAQRQFTLGLRARVEFSIDDPQPIGGAVEFAGVDFAELLPDMDPVGDDFGDCFELVRAARDVVEAIEAERRDSLAESRLFFLRQAVNTCHQPIPEPLPLAARIEQRFQAE